MWEVAHRIGTVIRNQAVYRTSCCLFFLRMHWLPFAVSFFFGLMCPDGRRNEKGVPPANVLHLLSVWSHSCWFPCIIYISLIYLEEYRTRSGPPPEQLRRPFLGPGNRHFDTHMLRYKPCDLPSPPTYSLICWADDWHFCSGKST